MKKLVLAAAIAGVLGATSAHAGFLYIDQQAPARTTIPVPDNNFFRSQLGLAGVSSESFSASLGLTAPGSIRVDYFGNEAVFINSFVWNGVTLGTTPGSLVDPWAQRLLGNVQAGAGLLPFSFCTAGGTGVPAACVTNAQTDSRAPTALNGISSFISGDGNVAWLLWDDGGGGPDDNHDDMIIRLTYSVPEPGTLGLLGLGLLAAGVATRRRMQR